MCACFGGHTCVHASASRTSACLLSPTEAYAQLLPLLYVSCRYDVLQEMLEVLRDHQNNEHMSRLEWIVIILIALAVSHCATGCNNFGNWGHLLGRLC